MTDRWLRCRAPRVSPRARVVCLPHAGGAASFFGGWHPLVPPDIELWSVQYPGREDRLSEPPPGGMAELATAIARAIRPLAGCAIVLFGHSLGAVVAYEVARRLEHGPGVRPAHLVVSGRRAPSDPPGGDIHARPDDAVVDELVRLGGTDGSVLADPEARSVFLPTIRSDFRLAETYRHEPGPEPGCPLTAVFGTEDTEVDAEQARRWARHTTGPFTLRQLPGGHFYLLGREPAVLDIVAGAQAPALLEGTS